MILIQENRTFNNLFATFPGAVGTTTGYERVGSGKKAKTVPITLAEVNLDDKKDLNHMYGGYITAYRQGNMDAFNLIRFQTNNKPEGKLPYQYVNPSQIQEYWTLAQSYGLADEMFQTQGSGSFTAHQDLIRGGTEIDATDSLIDDPTSAAAWGCDSPPGTVTSLITTNGQYERGKGPLPCTSDFPGSGSSYQTLADLLDANSISWKYYAPKFVKKTSSALWNAFDVIAHVRNGSEWGTNVSFPQTNILKDISANQLPAVSWVIPSATDSDHPGLREGHRPLVGGQRRERDRQELGLELDRRDRALGRLGRLLRSGRAGAARPSRRPGLPRSDDRHLPVRTGRRDFEHDVRVRRHPFVHRKQLGPGMPGNHRLRRDEHRGHV